MSFKCVLFTGFELARGYHIERDNYVADLLRKPPVPPDEGCDTVVKPIKQEENDENITGEEKEDKAELSHKRKLEKTNIQENTKKKRHKRKKYTSDSSSMEKSDRSYDFKYDY